MTTYTDTLAPKVARVPESAATYRLVRPLERDEEARVTARKREEGFRNGEMDTMKTGTILGAAVTIGAIMYLAASYGNWFLDSMILLQITGVVISLHATRRVFALLVGRAGGGAYFNGGDFSRHFTVTDAALGMVFTLLAITHLAASPIVQAVAAALVIIGFATAQRLSVRALRTKLQAAEAQEMELELADVR